MINSQRYNPYFNFSFNLTVFGDYKEFENRLKILDNYQIFNPEIESSKSHKLKLRELDLLIGYECLEDNKTQCQMDIKRYNHLNVILDLNYNGFTLDH